MEIKSRMTPDGSNDRRIGVSFRSGVSGRSQFSPSQFSGRGMQTEQPNSVRNPLRDSAGEKDRTFLVKMLDRIIAFSIFAIFFGFPLYFTGLASQGVIFEKQIFFYFFLLLGLVTWAAKGVIIGEMNIRRTPLDIPIIGFWLACALSTFFSVDRWHSFWGAWSDPSRGLMAITAYIVAFYFILSNFNQKRLKQIFAAIITSGALLLIWTIMAILNVKFMPESLAAYAPLSLLGSLSSLGMMLTVLVPVLTVAILKLADSDSSGNLRKKIFLGGMLFMLALDLFLILSLYDYVAWLGFFVGIVIFLIFILAKIMRPKESWTWLPMVVFVLVMVLKLTGAVSIAKVNLPIEVSLNYQTSSQIAKESIKNKFFVGSGPATYGYDFSLYRPKDFNLNALYNLRFAQGTGVLAESVSTLGVLGTFFLIILILSYAGTQVYLLYKNKERNKLYSLGVFSAAVILIVDGLSMRMDGSALVLGALVLILSLAITLLESNDDAMSSNYLGLSLKASPKFALALAFVFMVVSAGVAFLFVFLGKVYAADIYARSASVTLAPDSDQAIKDIGKAVAFNNNESNYFLLASQYYMSLANAEAAKNKDSINVDLVRQYLNFSVQAAVQARDMNKNDIGTVESLALIYENAGLYVTDSLDLAQQNYNRALELEPHNPVYPIKLGQIELAKNSNVKDDGAKRDVLSKAKGYFQKSVDEKNNFAEGYYQLALAYEALDQLDQAIDNDLKAVQLDSKNTSYILAAGRMYQARGGDDDMKLAEQYYKALTSLNDKDVNGHFYLGLLYEKTKKKDEAKGEYNKVISILKDNPNNSETVAQLQKMIANVDKGVDNTPQNLGLSNNASNNDSASSTPAPSAGSQESAQPANSVSPTIDNVQNP